jgi:predicted glycoside hydrolase/deacetylase ChbG (UPF0249 family)
MKPNPILKKLGFSDTDRLVIIHVDDVGMCQSSVQAFIDLWEFGTISSGSIMMPCSWARAAADYCRAHPKVDMGVHATLNAEWEVYRWRPLSTRDPGTGLIDDEGFLWRSAADAQTHDDPEAVQTELQAQVQRALDWGVPVTHLDTHMGTVAHARFIPVYLQAAIQNRIPPLLPRNRNTLFGSMGMATGQTEDLNDFNQELEQQGLPLVDAILMMPLDEPEGQIETAKKLLGQAPVGVTHFLFHPAIDTPELRSACPDWPSRVSNYQAFMSKELKAYIKSCGIHVIGYRELGNTMTF